ncbi:hypothetical protein F5B20DRAFT_113692 [Whalleya microplaca]|nr:hypothetical protein F5B20DRAFT_113692 [Whalleya microplaca]
MDDRPITADSKHNYPSQQPLWSRSTSSPAVPRLSSLAQKKPDPLVAAAAAAAAQYPAHQVDWIPIFFPHHSSLYQAQLLQYNKLIAPGRGGGLQTPPLPPLLSPQNVYVGPRSRSSSRVSIKDSRARQQGSQNCHGTRGNQNTSKADRALITGKDKDTPPKMPPKKSELSHPLPTRPKQNISPSNLPPHPNSVPSTPHQHARKFSFESRDQSPNANQSHSPRSAYSETNGALPSLRPLPPRQGGCKYETGLKHSRRRMPYSIGSDQLEKSDLQSIKSKLSEDDERKLTTDMRELYDRLQPTDAVAVKRQKLVQKLEKLLNDSWPGHDIRVHLFGSSGNLLCSDDSDVDICITTPWKELEGVCMLADLLAKHGMEKVICVSSAKVPIVKIWDPELELACDMNVNNTLALENTRMIKTYVEIDERVRPLAMIIKYWTRRRIVNDAAYGGTLSSYTWICMIIAFLQLRQPPVLPALHQRPHQKLPRKDGERAAFADDLNKLRGFGDKNKSTLGELLFQFFRFFAHEFDYSTHVLSLRLGKVITKKDKKWHFALNNQLCVEEPFNVSRNLGNTADDTAFRGLHIELRRAFDLIAEGKLDDCCEQYVYPKEEERIFQKPAQVSRPILLRSASQQHSNRGGRGGTYRSGNRQGQHRNNGNNNNNNNSRRASSSVPFDNNPQMYFPTGYPVTLSPQDAAAMYMQPSPEMVAQTLSALQLQENNLRFLQYTQSQAFAQHQAIQHAQRMQGNASQAQPSSTERSRTNSFDTPPLSAPLRPEMRPEMFYYPMQLQHAQAFYAQQGFPTYPSSPSNNQSAEFRRSAHRSGTGSDTGHNLSGSSIRSHSQPASRTVAGLPTAQNLAATSQAPNGLSSIPARLINGIPMPSFIPDEGHENEPDGSASNTPPEDEKSFGYYADPSSPPRRTSGSTSGMPAFGDIGPSRGRLSSDHFPPFLNQPSRDPSPLGHNRAYSVGRSSAPLASAPFTVGTTPPTRETAAPLVVNGSVSKPSNGSSPRQTWQSEGTPTQSATAQYVGYDNPLHISQRSETASSVVETPSQASVSRTSNSPTSDRPVVVNGSSHSPALVNSQLPGYHFAQDAVVTTATSSVSATSMSPVTTSSGPNGTVIGNAPNGFQRCPRPSPSPLIAQLDLATENRMQANELQHLSPVYEANSPSPSFSRKLELPFDQSSTRSTFTAPSQPDTKAGSAKAKQKLVVETSTKPENSTLPNPRVNGLLRENGHVRGAKSESDNTGINTGSGWQKMARGKKKGNDAKIRNEVFPQSEQLPKNDSERKGG